MFGLMLNGRLSQLLMNGLEVFLVDMKVFTGTLVGSTIIEFWLV